MTRRRNDVPEVTCAADIPAWIDAMGYREHVDAIAARAPKTLGRKQLALIARLRAYAIEQAEQAERGES